MDWKCFAVKVPSPGQAKLEMVLTADRWIDSTFFGALTGDAEGVCEVGAVRTGDIGLALRERFDIDAELFIMPGRNCLLGVVSCRPTKTSGICLKITLLPYPRHSPSLTITTTSC